MIVTRSVKFYLTLWYAFILFVLLSVFAGFMYAEFSRVLYQDVDRNLSDQAVALEKSLSQFFGAETMHSASQEPLPVTVADWETMNRQLTRSTLMIRLLSMDQTVLQYNLKGWEQEIIFPDFERDSLFMENGKSFQIIHFQKKPIRLYYHLFRFQGRSLMVIQCGKPIEEIRSTLDRLMFILLILIPGAVLSSGIAGWILAKRSFRPLDSMINEARTITAAYLEKRLPRTQSGDELDRLAETLNDMMNRLEASTRAIQDFSSDISHELKTPLAIIRGEIDVSLRRKRTVAELEETLNVIGGEVNELIRLVDDLMLLVRSDAKQLRFEKNPISVQEVLRSVQERYRDLAESKGIRFNMNLQAKSLILGDAFYLKRLFTNLIDNAIKFTPQSGSVSVDLELISSFLCIRVKDTGIGIKAELQQKVFSRFYRTDQARSYEGAGLGLNIAKAISDAHGGQISIESEPGQGTTVLVKLPLFQDSIN